MRLILIGAGGYGKTVADVASQLNIYDYISFLDDNSTDDKVVGRCADYVRFVDDNTVFYPALGNNEARIRFIDQLVAINAKIATIIHPSAYVSPTAKIAEGVVVLPKSIVNTDVVIERGCIINCGAIVDHGCVISSGAHICLGAIVKAENRIPAYMKIEAGEVVENRKFPLNGV